MKITRKIFWAVYILLVLLFIWPIFANVFSLYVAGRSSLTLVILDLIQRISGALAFLILFVQILVGAYPKKFASFMGKAEEKLHFRQGKIIYFLVLLHFGSFLLFNFVSKHIFDPFYVLTDFCVLCQTKEELFYSFGRFGFWLLTLTMAAALLRDKDWWRENWHYFHLFNYFLFFLITAHALFIARDFSRPGYLFYLALVLTVVVFLTVLEKFFSWFKRNFRWR